MDTDNTQRNPHFNPKNVLEAHQKFLDNFFVNGLPTYSPQEMSALMGYAVADLALMCGDSNTFLGDFFTSLNVSLKAKIEDRQVEDAASATGKI